MLWILAAFAALAIAAIKKRWTRRRSAQNTDSTFDIE
ncbi:hypothetical protein BX591_120115 [Paraburkholderia bryophila]|jgi:hypothetical protein|uniref:Uncharacterized protein n=1 Tax=Paraburkholderia bryophila TaxID=420952 RepID=A0A329BMK0_9BURK|nr:hypothetical protein BX591_120115 [Paraburkholderia bryophila]